ncbi:MAG TPA: AAA family ATPase [Gemmataceae bacterium]|nr:AAA family ATPase [Gemmataceae bacterium]
MPQNQKTEAAPGNGAPPAKLDEYLVWVHALSAAGRNLLPVTETVLREKFALQEAVDQLRAHHEALREEIESLCAPERYPAVITGVHRNGDLSVEVHGAGQRLRVAVHPDVDPDQLRVGARGLLAKGRNCLLEVDGDRPEWHEVGTFEGYTEDGRRLLIRHQEQLVAATPAEELEGETLRKGDLVGFNRDGAWLAYSRVEPPGKEDLFIEETPADRFEELGGLDKEIAQLQRVIRFRLQHPELAARYRLPAKRGILLEGPPGNGKTKLARCLARFIADLMPAGECRFMAVSGSSDYSMWLGQSEQKIIARFQAAREIATQNDVPVVMFFDEIDAIGRRRGSDLGGAAPDRILATFLAQLDGMQSVGNVIVIGATNRADILDAGLVRPGRLGDLRLRIPPPSRGAARAILGRYLGNGLPLAGDLESLVEGLLSRIYSPRGEYGELARVGLRDGRKLTVGGRDLVSGAMLENLVRSAAEEAADREAQTGHGGVSEDDLIAALDRELRGAAALLSPGNVRGYVPRLPQDVDPVAVEPLARGAGTAAYARTA